MPRFFSKKHCAPYCDWRDVYLEEMHRGAHAENGVWVIGPKDEEATVEPIRLSKVAA